MLLQIVGTLCIGCRRSVFSTLTQLDAARSAQVVAPQASSPPSWRGAAAVSCCFAAPGGGCTGCEAGKPAASASVQGAGEAARRMQSEPAAAATRLLYLRLAGVNRGDAQLAGVGARAVGKVLRTPSGGAGAELEQRGREARSKGGPSSLATKPPWQRWDQPAPAQPPPLAAGRPPTRRLLTRWKMGRPCGSGSGSHSTSSSGRQVGRAHQPAGRGQAG